MRDILNGAFELDKEERENLCFIKLYSLSMILSFSAFIFVIWTLAPSAKKKIKFETTEKVRASELKITERDTVFVYEIIF